MKKIFSLFAAALMLGFSSPGAFAKSHHRQPNLPHEARPDSRLGKVMITDGGHVARRAGKLHSPADARTHKTPPAPTSNVIRKDAPEGTRTMYQRTTFSYFPFWGMIYSNYDYGSAMEFVKTADGKIFVNNPASSEYLDVWLEVSEKDGVYTIAPGQAVDYNEFSEEYLYVCALRYVVIDEDTQEGWFLPTETGEFKLKKEGDKIVSADPDVMLGICYYMDNGYDWSGLGDCQIEMTLFDAAPLQLPETAKVDPVRYGCIPDGEPAYFSTVATDGNDIYVKGINTLFPDVWVKGIEKDGKWLLPPYSYLGVHEGHHVYVSGGKIEEVYDPDWQTTVEEVIVRGAPEFSYDAATGVFKNLKPIVFPTTDDPSAYQLIGSCKELSIHKQSKEPTTPTKVYDLLYHDLFEEDGYNHITFNWVNLDVNNTILDPDKLFYNVYIDDKLLTLERVDYKGLEQSMTNIPYKFCDTKELDIWADGLDHDIYIYIPAPSTIGIQPVFIDGDTTLKGEMVSIEVQSGVGNISCDDRSIESVELFDLTGRRVSVEAKGILLERVRFSDGRIMTRKKVCK